MNNTAKVSALPSDHKIDFKKTSMLHEQFDLWALGGASLLMILGFHLFVPASSSSYQLSWIMFYASFAINYPHFLASYQLLYWDNGRKILKDIKYFWAAIIAPLILLGIFSWGFISEDRKIMSGMVQLMYVTVGWHYVKQSFGIAIVTSAKKKFFFTKPERYSLLAFLLSLAVFYFISVNVTADLANFYGINYSLFGIPEVWKYVSAGLTVFFLLLFFMFSLFRFIHTGEKMPLVGWIAVLGMGIWYTPLFYHPHFFLMLPFFHSLQYLVIVVALKKGKWRDLHNTPSSIEKRRTLLAKYSSFFLTSIGLGFLFFYGIPTFLDGQFSSQEGQLSRQIIGPAAFMAIFHLFINIHHYFIDNVIWRKDNDDLKLL